MMDNYKTYSVCAICFRNGNMETIQVKITTESPEAAKEGATKYWRSKGIEPYFLDLPFEVIEEGANPFGF